MPMYLKSESNKAIKETQEIESVETISLAFKSELSTLTLIIRYIKYAVDYFAFS